MSPIFKVPKRLQRVANKDTQIVGGTKLNEQGDGPKILSRSTPAKSVKIESKHDVEEIPVQSHTRSRPKRKS